MDTVRMSDLMNRLKKTYKESGGKLDDDNIEEITKNMNAFDALKVLVANKLEKVRKHLSRRDEILEKNDGVKNTGVVKIESEIRQMIKFIKNDLEKLQAMHKKKKDKEKDPNDQQNEIDLNLIASHIKEVEAMLKKRTEVISQEKKVKVNDISSIFQDIPDNPLESSLPKIDISKSLEKVQNTHKLIEEGITDFGQKVDKLKDITLEINGELDDHKRLLETIDEKTMIEKAKIEAMSKKIDYATDQTNTSFRLAIAFICFLVLLIIVATIVLYISITIVINKASNNI